MQYYSESRKVLDEQMGSAKDAADADGTPGSVATELGQSNSTAQTKAAVTPVPQTA